jgi:DNA-binding transcriptional regulator YbjK
MKDHPDEFLMHRKWDELIETFGEHFTEEELDAYKAARSEMMRDLFNEAVLKRLAG